MSYHFYDTHPENGREISVFIDDEMIVATYEDDDDAFFMANADEDDLREAFVNEFGEEFARRAFAE